MQTLKKRLFRDYHRLRRMERQALRKSIHKRLWRIGRRKQGKEAEG